MPGGGMRRRDGEHVLHHPRARLVEVEPLLLPQDVAEPGVVIGEVADRHRFVERRGKVLQILRERRVEVDPAARVQNEETCYHRRHLGRAGDVQHGIGVHRELALRRRVSRSAVAEDFPVFSAQDRTAQYHAVFDLGAEKRKGLFFQTIHVASLPLSRVVVRFPELLAQHLALGDAAVFVGLRRRQLPRHARKDRRGEFVLPDVV